MESIFANKSDKFTDASSALVVMLGSDEFKRTYELDLLPIDHEAIEEATHAILDAVGEDPTREGLLKTPKRVALMYDELLSGYRTDPAKGIDHGGNEGPIA